MINLFDSFVLDGVRRTNDGYIAAFAKVARTGIQTYKGSELGRPDLESVRLYRPPEEVFAPDAMRSFAHRPVTLQHPPKPVTAKNWKQYARGQTGDEVVRDSEYVRVPMIMMDQGLIDAYEKGGIKELSMGYSTEIKWGKGTVPADITDAGQEYDAIQTEIRGNHLAVVPVARGGDQLRIGDAGKCPDCGADMQGNKCSECNYVKDNGELQMKTIIVDGLSVNVADDQSASIIQRVIDTATTNLKVMTDAFEDFKKKAKKDGEETDKALKDAQASVQAKDGEIAVLKKQVTDAAVTPEKLDVMVKDRLLVIGKAKTLVDAAYVFDGKTIEQIRKDAVVASLGDSAKTMQDGEIVGAFVALTKDAKAGDSTNQLVDAMSRRPHSSGTNITDAAQVALDARDKEMADAWKRPAA